MGKEEEKYITFNPGTVFGRRKRPENIIRGMHKDGVIYQPPDVFIERIATFIHEAGHTIANEISFVDGTVLLPDEVKATSVNFGFRDRVRIVGRLFSIKSAHMDPFDLYVALRLLVTFTKGNYDVFKLRMVNIKEDKFSKITQELESTDTVEIDGGTVTPIRTRSGRDIEIPPVTVTYGCMMILVNSINIVGMKASFSMGGSLGSHQAAQEIVQRASKGTDWKLPSYVDMGTVDE